MEEHLKDLKPAHATFVTEYLKNGGNATAAYKVAYPEIAQESAEASASRLLRNDKVAQAIAAGKAQLAQAAQDGLNDAAKHIREGITMAGITQERILVECARMGLSNLADAFDGMNIKALEDMGEDTQRAVAQYKTRTITRTKGDEETTEVITEIKLHDKNAAVDKLMKNLGMFEKHNKQLTDPITDLLNAIDGRGKLTPAAA